MKVREKKEVIQNEHEAECKRQKRSNPNVKEHEAECKRQRRSDPKVKEHEAQLKRLKRKDSTYSKKEAMKELNRKRMLHQDQNAILCEKQQAHKRKYGSDMKELLKIFNESVSDGPVYVCTVCQQTWFKHSVVHVPDMKLKKDDERTMFDKCRTGFISEKGKEWMCKTCRTAISEAQIPKLSVYNKMGFPEQPSELKLYPMEERLIA